jgi:hypothetical protein
MSASLRVRGRTPVHPLVRTFRFTIPMHQTMTSVHGPSIRTDRRNTIKEKYAHVVVTISKALSTHLLLDLYNCQRRRGGHKTGDRESSQNHHTSAACVLGRRHPPVCRPARPYAPHAPPSSTSSGCVDIVGVGGVAPASALPVESPVLMTCPPHAT